MTKDEIIELAKQAGMPFYPHKQQVRFGVDQLTGDNSNSQVVRFAELVAAKEREACAIIGSYVADFLSDGSPRKWADGRCVADAIRARGNK